MVSVDSGLQKREAALDKETKISECPDSEGGPPDGPSSSSPLRLPTSSSSDLLSDVASADRPSSYPNLQYSAYPGAVNVGIANGLLQQATGFIASPLYSPYQQTYQGPLYAQSYQDWGPQGPGCYTSSLYPEIDLMSSPTPGSLDQRRYSYQYGGTPMSPIMPYANNVGETSPSTGNQWRGIGYQGGRRSSCVSTRQHHTGRYNTNFVNRRNIPTVQNLGYAVPSSPDASAVYSSQFQSTVSAANAIALAQVAQQAALQTSGKYGSSSPLSSPVSGGSPLVPALEISPDVLAKVSTGKPIPPPVPSLFAAPTFEEALGSSLYNPNNTTNVYIRGLPPDTTDESLVDICERFGDIKSSKAIVDSQTSNCKGFGFVLFAKEADATACIAGLIYYGYQVSFAKESFSTRLKNLQDPDSTNLYLSNLPQTMHEKDLEALFQPYKVVSNRILRDSNNISRGVGFARMCDRESAEAIIANFDNSPIGEETGNLPLQVRFADSQSQKRLKAVTQRRRQWRAREYNILTQGLDHPLPGGLPLFDPSASPTESHYGNSSMSLSHSQSDAPHNMHSFHPLLQGDSSKPRTMPDAGVESKAETISPVIEKEKEELALQISEKLSI